MPSSLRLFKNILIFALILRCSGILANDDLNCERALWVIHDNLEVSHLDAITDSIETIGFSSDRSKPNLFKELNEKINKLKAKLQAELESLQRSLNFKTEEYKKSFDFYDRFLWNIFSSRARDFRKREINPLKSEIKIKEIQLQKIQNLLVATENKLKVEQISPQLSEGLQLFNAFYAQDDIDSATALSSALRIMGNANLSSHVFMKNVVELTTNEALNEWDTPSSLAIALVSVSDKQNEAKFIEMIAFVDKVYEKVSSEEDIEVNTAVQLALSFWSRNISTDAELETFIKTAQNIAEDNELFFDDVIPLTLKLHLTQTPYQSTIHKKLISDFIEAFEDLLSNKEICSLIALTITTKNPSIIDPKTVLNYYEKFNENFDSSVSLLLTKASLMSSDMANAIKTLSEWTTYLYENSELNEIQAAALSARAFNKSLLDDDALNTGLFDSADSNSSSSSGIFDSTQMIITGNPINLDGNPFTKF